MGRRQRPGLTMRYAEIALFAAPFLAFLAWRLIAPAGGAIPRSLVIGVLAGVAVLAGLLITLRVEETAPPGSVYIPAREEDGRIIPGRLAPPADARR